MTGPLTPRSPAAGLTTRPAAAGPNRAWIKAAACAGLGDLMFPERDRDIAAAKRVCRGCPLDVRIACLDEALTVEGPLGAGGRHGVRGGFTGRQRRRLYEQRTTAEEALTGRKPGRRAEPGALRALVARRTRRLEGGHVEWTGSRYIEVDGRRYTTGQAVFVAAHGRDPVGSVRRECRVDGCVAVGHLADQAMRESRREAPAPVVYRAAA